MADPDAASRDKPPEVARIDSTFRNGSMTAIGVVVGFSLGFLSNWATSDGTWQGIDMGAVAFIALGIALQIWSLSGMLGVNSLILSCYERLVRIFLVGLSITAIGVVLAVIGDVVSHNLAASKG
jgi:hypothetical protein